MIIAHRLPVSRSSQAGTIMALLSSTFQATDNSANLRSNFGCATIAILDAALSAAKAICHLGKVACCGSNSIKHELAVRVLRHQACPRARFALAAILAKQSTQLAPKTFLINSTNLAMTWNISSRIGGT